MSPWHQQVWYTKYGNCRFSVDLKPTTRNNTRTAMQFRLKYSILGIVGLNRVCRRFDSVIIRLEPEARASLPFSSAGQ